jgi:cytochrome P450
MLNARARQHPAGGLPPGPRGYPLVGILPQVIRNPLKTLTDAARQYGGVVYLGSYRPGKRILLISHPGPLKYVLQERYRSYDQSSVVVEAGVRLLGQGLPFLKGDSWLRRRRLLQPAFNTKHIFQFVSAITNKAMVMLEQWRTPATRGEVLNISSEMSKVTRNITLKILFGLDLPMYSEETVEIERSIEVAESYVSFLNFINPTPLWAPTPRNRAFQRALQTFDRMVRRIIDERRRDETEHHHLLSLLMAARDQDSGEGLNNQELHDEVRTGFLAGHETTAASLTWTWFLLSTHPEAERRLQAEVDDVLGGRLPTIDDLPRLVYTRMVMMESLRLFPPAWLASRSLNSDEEDEIGGHVINKKTVLFISPYVTHHLPELWENPDAFDPERFAPERLTKLPQFTYIPFGGGPHQCIGANLAQIESQLILATVSQRYSLRLAPGARIYPKPLTTIQPYNGLPMTIHARN